MCLVLFQSGLGEDLLRVEQPEALPPCAVPDDHPATVRVHVGVRAAPLTVGLGLHSLEKKGFWENMAAEPFFLSDRPTVGVKEETEKRLSFSPFPPFLKNEDGSTPPEGKGELSSILLCLFLWPQPKGKREGKSSKSEVAEGGREIGWTGEKGGLGPMDSGRNKVLHSRDSHLSLSDPT